MQIESLAVAGVGADPSRGRDAIRQDERDKLASLLDHGADTLVRVLSVELAATPGEVDTQLCRWLSRSLLDRLYLTQWVLGHWGAAPVLEIDERVGAGQFADQLRCARRIFSRAAASPALRSRLHWNNGALSRAVEAGELLRLEGEWPAGLVVSSPAAGLFGYVLGEVLVNAIKYGAPGQAVVLQVQAEPGALRLCVRNVIGGGASPRDRSKRYGGLGIVGELARLSGWTLTRRAVGGRFELSCRCPVDG